MPLAVPKIATVWKRVERDTVLTRFDVRDREDPVNPPSVQASFEISSISSLGRDSIAACELQCTGP